MTPRFHLIDPAQTAHAPALTPAAVRPAPLAQPEEPVSWSEITAPYGEDVYLPQGYEPKYPYPLLVWIQLPGAAPFDLQSVMDDISDRNYCGLRIELPELQQRFATTEHTESTWQAAPTWLWDDILRTAILEMRNRFHIHSERIYLAGIGAGGIAAIQQMLCRPEWFAGAIAIHSELPTGPVPMPAFSQLQGKKVWLSHAETEAADNRSLRIMDLAGIDVQAVRHVSQRAYDRKLLLQIDRWLMHGICRPQHA